MTGFTFISGNLGLDFAGTMQHRRSDRRELLSGPADLGRWLVEAAVLDAPPHVVSLEPALALREAIYDLATPSRTAAAARDVVNRVAAAPPVTVRLTADGVQRMGDLDAALSTVARSAVELLGGPALAGVRECGDEHCTRLYVDTSRARSRRWCDMQVCGNRAKAAGFRARHA
ncbi:ABATE domain-containing protein [Nonomuraea sp. NBC_01738]|uniref:CGNR zinc finger domain-containing protein n=1 Tax=Nonomuraea sp. NBC_01738 TaxID=2976003 RepID=UPI002E1513F2|nr:ABATE domain-containing protein [Nonomuraea sp. NBC_01738]